MKNIFSGKRKIIIISSAAGAIIVLAVTLLFTLFGLKLDKVNLQVHNDYSAFMTEQYKDEVIQTSILKQNQSVFFINKTQVMAELEQEFPNMKVINIETVFPNSLLIHIAKREELFAIKSQNTESYFVVDGDLKVLSILPQASYESDANNAILLSGITITTPSVVAGDFLSFENDALIKNLAKAFLVNNLDVVEQKALLKKIDIQTDQIREYLTNDDKTIIEITMQDEFQILVYSPNTYLKEKIQTLFATLPSVYPNYINTYFLEIYERLNNTIFPKLSLKN